MIFYLVFLLFDIEYLSSWYIIRDSDFDENFNKTFSSRHAWWSKTQMCPLCSSFAKCAAFERPQKCLPIPQMFVFDGRLAFLNNLVNFTIVRPKNSISLTFIQCDLVFSHRRVMSLQIKSRRAQEMELGFSAGGCKPKKQQRRDDQEDQDQPTEPVVSADQPRNFSNNSSSSVETLKSPSNLFNHSLYFYLFEVWFTVNITLILYL